MQVKQKDYSGSYTAIRVFHGFGVLVICVGVLVALMGAGGANRVSQYGGSGAMAMFIAALPGAGIFIAGIFNVAFAKMAEASVHTAEMTQQLLMLAAKQSGGAGDDVPRWGSSNSETKRKKDLPPAWKK